MLRQLIYTPWNFMRWLRLFLGFSLIMQFIQSHDPFSAIVGAFFLYQVYSNTGCCGTNECAAPLNNNQATDKNAIQFEEIKSTDIKK
jgi:hypothetical protein